MVDLDSLKDSGKFEDLCAMLFRGKLGIRDGATAYRPPNYQGVESEPVTIDGRTYSFQAKYLEGSTRLKDRKGELRKCVRDARQIGVTDLLIFVNKDKWVVTNGVAPNVDPAYITEIEGEARGDGAQSEVRLEWWFKRGIEDALESEENRHIRDRFFGERPLETYYEYVCDQFEGDEGSKLYGDIPLRKCYIEPMVEGDDGRLTSVREYIESRIEGDVRGDGSITVICGEPGHGKTSLCRKAVRDFYRDGWLAGKVTNALCFSLNPAGTDALEHEPLRFNSLLSWEDVDGDRMDDNHMMKPSRCHRALVLLDGFDELLEWHPKFDLEGFIKRFVARFQRDTKAHVVITTRSMAVEPDRRRYADGIPVARLQLVSKARQLEWIGRCADYYRRFASGEPGLSARVSRNAARRKLEELEGYLIDYEKLHEDATLQKILGIPIILRMVVAARYVPEGGKSIVQVYDDLFAITWDRHPHREADSPEGDRERLSHHALRIYVGDADTAPVDDFLKSPWQFSFYTTNKGERRVGFLHRSFYQYFLAHEVVSWLRECAGNEDEEGREKALRANLAGLARRRLDEATLCYIGEIHEGLVRDGVSLEDSLDMAYETLKDTDGILPLPAKEVEAVGIKALAPLARANNVFWNVVSVCGACGREVNADRVNVEALRSYDLSGCFLLDVRIEGLVLSGAHLSRSLLDKADLRDARLERADLSRAHLSQARLSRARLDGADLREAHLDGADLHEAHLDGADLRGAVLERADLGGAHLGGADLRDARLERADLRDAHLEEAHLERATLRGADLRDADLERAALRDANLRGARLERAHIVEARLERAHIVEARLERAHIEGAHLEGAHLEGAHLGGADLRGADLEGAHLERTRLDEANLRGVNLREAYLERADLREARLEWADLREAHLEEARLERADLEEANLGGADLEGADLRGACLRGACLRGAYLERAHLEGANLGGADLGVAHLRGAHLEGANLERADLGGACLVEAHLRRACLDEADLRGADLRGAYLRGAALRGAALRGADLELTELERTDLRRATSNGQFVFVNRKIDPLL